MSDKQPNLDSLFEAAINLESAEERAAFLEKSCGDDIELRKRLESLLQSDQQAGHFLEKPPAEVEATFIGQAEEGFNASIDAGQSQAIPEEASVVIGRAGHSVLKSLGQLIDIPRVALRESKAEAEEPLVKPKSAEMPDRNADTRYQLLGEIARGGMGVIIKGRDVDLGRDLAIKVLQEEHTTKPEVIQRFIEEAQIGGQLQHPGIAPIYELGQFADKRPYFAMKLVKGETLSKLLKERENPTEDRGKFLGIFEQVCQTMAYAHSRGVIHRDLKPANIMVGAFGEVQVVDWGLAKVLPTGGIADEKQAHTRHKDISIIQTMRSAGSDTPGTIGSVGSQTQMGSVMGTPAYMPPEQALGEIDNLDERADVFALGAILCEILTGKPPYVHEDGRQVYRMASRGKLGDAFSRLEACGADEDLTALTKQCLELEPVERPRDAGELAKRVTGYLGSVESKLRETEQQRAVEAARVEEERKRRHVQLALVASVLLMLVLSGGGWMYLEHRSAENQRLFALQKQKEQDDAEATRLVEGLLQADTSQIQAIIGELENYRQYATDDLKQTFAELPEDSNAKLHAGLAILPHDQSVLPFLKERLLTVSPVQFPYVRDLLSEYKDELIEGYWEIATNSTEAPARRFPAACALASYDANAERWNNKSFHTFLVEHLVSVLPSELLPWKNALRPIKAHLIAPLAMIYRDKSEREIVRDFATDTLADYLSDDAEGLFDLLADASDRQFAPMFDKLSHHTETAIALGNAEVSKTPAADAHEADKETLALRQANAAVMLLRMGVAENVWPLLKHSPDPRVRSYIIHWLSSRGGDPEPILTRYHQETDVTIKRVLLLCLGEFEQSRLPESKRNPLIENLLTVYRNDPDAGLHAAAEWLLRKWGQTEQLAAIDNDLQKNEEQLATDKNDRRQWYVNSKGQTFVILDAGEFQMGSPKWERERSLNEDLHQRKIGTRYAISTKEVTRAQWRVFAESQKARAWLLDWEVLEPFILTDDSPMMGMSWYETAHYCNWLSEQEGIAQEQWCYEPADNGRYDVGMIVKPEFWKLTGYRLPTEAEWEFACRSGTITTRHYGVTDTLLANYAWYQLNGDNHAWPVGSLKPNDFGLFDMHGNAFEWVYDAVYSYPTNTKTVTPDTPSTKAVSETESRILRGGAFTYRSPILRSARRDSYLPSAHLFRNGFRPVRTYPLSE